MDERVTSLYALPNISEYEDVSILSLRENCVALECQMRDILDHLSDHERQIVEAYLDIRDELEFETIKLALRWGKQHYR